MPKPSQRADVNTFTGGLITEASPLNFPPNAMADGRNFELHRTGIVSRRLGINFEENYTLTPTIYPTDGASDFGFGTFRWDAANGDPNANFVVFQLGNSVYFYKLNQKNITETGLYGSVGIADFPNNVDYSFAAVDGILVIASGVEKIAVVQYNGSTFSLSYQRLLVRDLWGMEETFESNYETDPSHRGGDNLQHRYNLMNQSWGIPRKNKDGTYINPIGYFVEGIGLLPNNSEQVWVGLQFQAVASGTDPFERMFTNLYNDSLGAKTSSAKGYFIIDALRRGQGRIDAVTRNTGKYPLMAADTFYRSDYSPGGAKCLAQFAGRVFYAGFTGQVVDGDKRSPNLNNYVLFSQLTKNQQDLNKCYQEGDPTSREDSDLLETDGGFIRISGANNIVAMRSLGLSLMVFAENGVWSITGGDTNSGFSATNYKVSRLSTFGAVSERSIVVENDSAFYWSNDGIYSLARDQYGDYKSQSMTLATIQQFYQSIPNVSKKQAFGEYDEINKKIRWIYRMGNPFTETSVTSELIFDSQLNAFTANDIGRSVNASTEIVGVFRTLLFFDNLAPNDVFAGTDAVLANTDQVQIPLARETSNDQILRYFTISNQAGVLNITVSSYRDVTFRDWKVVDGIGVDAKAFCLTGDQTAGDSAIDKQIPYLVFSFIRTESGVDTNFQPLLQSSCFFRMQWNFANAIQSNKWTPLWQGYRYRKALLVSSLQDDYDIGFSVIQSKNKVRGRGKAFALYFETEPYKDLQMAGWNLTVNGNQVT